MKPIVTIDGTSYEVPAITLGQLRGGLLDKIREHDKLNEDGKTFEALIMRGEIIAEALRKKHKDLSVDAIMDALDMGNMQDVWMAVLGVSGLKPGETKAEEAKPNGTSTLSTAH